MKQTVNVGGITLGPDSDLAGLLRRQMLEGSVWSVFRNQGPEEGLDLAMEAVRSTDLEGQMTEAVMRLLTDPDVTVRTRAIWLAKNYATRFNSLELLRLLEDHANLYVGVKPAVQSRDPDLAWGLLQAMLGHPTASEKVRGRLRVAALDPDDGPKLLAVLTQLDTDWVFQHSLELVTTNRFNAGIILANLTDELRREFVNSFKNQPLPVREIVGNAIRSKIADPSELSNLTQRLALDSSAG